ncbi:MAG: hypothetical protein IKL39_05650 [Mailhella sp.]|nr:hypothetical protein [Mailhella sp.]
MALKRVTLPFGPWEPDSARLGGTQSCEVSGVLPASRGWRPMNGLSALPYPPLPGPALAAFSCREGEAITTLAATAGGIFSLENGQWKSCHSGDALTEARAFADYGEAVYALFGGALLKAGIDAGNVGGFEPVQGAPHASCLAVVRDFLFLGGLLDDPRSVRWSGLDRPDDWPDPGSDEAQFMQSDMQIFPTGGRVQAVLGGVGHADALIFLESAIERATYVGPPYLFQFDRVERRRGLLAPKSAVDCGGLCCFLSADGWHATDGASVRPIGLERVDRWFFEHCEPSRLAETRGVYDPRQRVALWSFASPLAAPGLHDRLLIYSPELDRWSCAELSCGLLFPDWTRGFSLEELDAFGPLDSLGVGSLDAASLRHGRLALFGFDASDRLCSMEGPSLEALLESAEHGAGRVFLHGFRPHADAPLVESMALFRTRLGEPRRGGPWSRPGREGFCPQHLSARWLSTRLRIPAGQDWSRASGIEALVEEE